MASGCKKTENHCFKVHLIMALFRRPLLYLSVWCMLESRDKRHYAELYSITVVSNIVRDNSYFSNYMHVANHKVTCNIAICNKPLIVVIQSLF